MNTFIVWKSPFSALSVAFLRDRSGKTTTAKTTQQLGLSPDRNRPYGIMTEGAHRVRTTLAGI